MDCCNFLVSMFCSNSLQLEQAKVGLCVIDLCLRCEPVIFAATGGQPHLPDPQDHQRRQHCPRPP
ncbi:unnamed protein product [Prunus brigantina]